MKFFIDNGGVIYAYEADGSQDEFIGDKKALTEAEVAEILNPPPSHDELVTRAESERARLLSYADEITADWRTELALGEISDDDKSSLSAWMAYKRNVKAIPVSDILVPGFAWPALPAV